MTNDKNEFIKLILKEKIIEFGNYKLKSGISSKYFINLSKFNNNISNLNILSQYYSNLIINSNINFNKIFGPAYKGITLSSIVALNLNINHNIKDIGLIYDRKEVKQHGEKGILVGEIKEKDKIIIIDDVITKGTAIINTINLLKNYNIEIVGVFIAINRLELYNNEFISDKIYKDFNIKIYSIVDINDILNYMNDNKVNSDIIYSIQNHFK